MNSLPLASDKILDWQYRQDLTRSIFALLKTNASNTRGVYFGLDSLPKGGLKSLIQNRPFDAVRAEVDGTTLTVELTTQRQGEQPVLDALCFATYDIESFRNWFFNRLCRLGRQPAQPAPHHTYTIKPKKKSLPTDLRTAPMFHRKKKRK